jgi:Fe-Mn family superoxide dismutase
MNFEREPLQLPDLPYSYTALEPILNSEILEVHHQKHHRGYVTKYNELLDNLLSSFYKNETEKVQKGLPTLHFLVGGHNCHALYWENLAPKDNGGGQLPDEKSLLTQAIVKNWGSYQNFKNHFNAKTGAIQGSGWGWLAFDLVTKQLSFEKTLGQDNVYADDKVPLLTVDVWEHAYYLQYKNLRPDYLKNIWDVINWRTVEERYLKCVL